VGLPNGKPQALLAKILSYDCHSGCVPFLSCLRKDKALVYYEGRSPGSDGENKLEIPT